MKRYGRPDSDDSTLHDKPRPAIVTRWITYSERRVRFAFALDPVKGWKLIGATDPATETVLSADELKRRMDR